MLSQFEIWEFLAGLGIFLLAMMLLREIHSGNKALIMAVKDLILQGESAADFEGVSEGIYFVPSVD